MMEEYKKGREIWQALLPLSPWRINRLYKRNILNLSKISDLGQLKSLSKTWRVIFIVYDYIFWQNKNRRGLNLLKEMKYFSENCKATLGKCFFYNYKIRSH